MSLHSLCVSLGIVRRWGWVREASGTPILHQACFRTLLSSSWPRPRPLSCRIHLVGRPLLYGRSEAHTVAGILGGISIGIIWQLGWAVKQATVSSRVISWWWKRRIWRSFLPLWCPREGVELGIGCMGHPGGRAWVIASCPRTWHRAGRNCTTNCSWRTAWSCSAWSGVGVGRAKLSLVVDDTGLGSRLIMGGGSNVVVAISWILGLDRKKKHFC